MNKKKLFLRAVLGLQICFTININAYDDCNSGMDFKNINLKDFSTNHQDIILDSLDKVIKSNYFHKLVQCTKKRQNFTPSNNPKSAFETRLEEFQVCQEKEYNNIYINLQLLNTTALFNIKNKVGKLFDSKYENVIYPYICSSLSKSLIQNKTPTIYASNEISQIKHRIPIKNVFKNPGLSILMQNTIMRNSFDSSLDSLYSLSITVKNCKRDSNDNSNISCKLNFDNKFKVPYSLSISQAKSSSVIDQFGQEQTISEFTIGNKSSQSKVTHVIYPSLAIEGEVKISLKGNKAINIIHLLNMQINLKPVEPKKTSKSINEIYKASNILIEN